jgi:hypothetical protein
MYVERAEWTDEDRDAPNFTNNHVHFHGGNSTEVGKRELVFKRREAMCEISTITMVALIFYSSSSFPHLNLRLYSKAAHSQHFQVEVVGTWVVVVCDRQLGARLCSLRSR